MVGSLKLKERLDTELPNTCPRSDTSEPPPPPEDDWLISIEENLKRARQYDAAGSESKINIYRVPQRLRDPLREKPYIPQVVSLGPYHHGSILLQPMELHKWRAVNHVLQRNNQSIKLYLDSMKELEERARACYEEPLELSSNKFAEMMVLDGCFVLEIFQVATEQDGLKELGYAWNDPVFSMQAGVIQDSIERDMKLLENQIPLFVLGRLLGLQLKKRDLLEDEVARLAIEFFSTLMAADEPPTRIDITKLKSSTRDYTTSDKVGLHCLDLFRKSLLYKRPMSVARKRPQELESSTGDSTTSDPPSAKAGLHCLDVFKKIHLYKGLDHVPWKRSRDNHEADIRRQQLIRCVTDLKDAGIKFRKHKTDRLWDIQFDNGVLYIPPILIEDSTESVLFNLIAFEQCHSVCKRDITSYVLILDSLINSAEDVRHLCNHKIIEHLLGDDGEVANLVNSLGQEVALDMDSDFSKLSEKINKYYDRKWNTWRAALMQKYFNNPWAILSLVAAVFLLLMTAAQTFYTVNGYYLPSK